MLRIASSVLCALVVLTLSVYAQRGGISPTEVQVRVVFPNERQVDIPVRVQLLNASGIPVIEAFTNSVGQVVFQDVRPGNYKLRVSGNGIVETVTDLFTVDPRDRLNSQYVQVKPSDTGPTEAAPQVATPVSASELNVPDKARKEFEKGTHAMSQSNWEEATKHLQKATEIYPQYASAFNNLGIIAVSTKDTQAAREYFQRAVTSDNHLASAYLNLGKLDYAEHKVREAQQPLSKVLAIDPNNVEALLLMSNSLLASGSLEQAILYARKIHTLPHERFAIAHMVAARALEATHQRDQAIQEYELFLKEAPNSSVAGGARQALVRLQGHP